MSENKVVHIDLKDGLQLRLKTRLFQSESDEEESEIDLDKLLMIDIRNLEAELITFPVILNMLGLTLADVTNRFNEAKISLEIYEAKLKERIYNGDDDEIEEDEDTGKTKLKRKYKKPTVDEVESKIHSDQVRNVKKRLMYTRQKEMEYMNSIYWSAKSKDDKLNRLSTFIKAGDIYDVLAASKLKNINGVNFSVVKPLIR